jgi:hypothetical protein
MRLIAPFALKPISATSFFSDLKTVFGLKLSLLGQFVSLLYFLNTGRSLNDVEKKFRRFFGHLDHQQDSTVNVGPQMLDDVLIAGPALLDHDGTTVIHPTVQVRTDAVGIELDLSIYGLEDFEGLALFVQRNQHSYGGMDNAHIIADGRLWGHGPVSVLREKVGSKRADSIQHGSNFLSCVSS